MSVSVGISFLGLSFSIYHPVGIALVVNSSKKKGKALGINGMFGGVGIGSGAFIAGLIIKYYNWKLSSVIYYIIIIVRSSLLLSSIKIH